MSKDEQRARQVLSVAEFAERVRYSERHVRRFIKKGLINAGKVEGGRKYLIPESEVSRFTHKGETILTSKATEEQMERRAAPPVLRHWKQHFEHLAEIAEWLCKGEYGLSDWQLPLLLEANAKVVCERYGQLDFDNFVSHLKAEYPEMESKGFFGIARENSHGLLETLKILAQRGAFRGICRVCEVW